MQLPTASSLVPSARAPRALPLVLLVGLASACSGDSGADLEIADGPLMGTVFGESWVFAAGHTNAFLSENEDDFFAVLYSESFETCGFSEPSGASLIVSIPKTAGTYSFNTQRNMTFTANADNKIATNGQIVVEEVSATSVRASLVGRFNGDNEVSGSFEIDVCAD